MEILIILIGLALGSFMNVIALRLHDFSIFSKKRSFCFHCKKQLKWFELLPVVSYLFQRGACRSCKKFIGPHYLIGEVGYTAVFFMTYQMFGLGWEFFAFAVIFFLYFILFIHDLVYMLVPDSIALLTLLTIFVVQFFAGASLTDVIGGMIIGGAFFGLQYAISKGKWIGWGDVHLGLIIGALLGISGVIIALFFAYIIGAGIGLSLILMKKATKTTHVAFGPYILTGAFIAFFYGNEIIRWYVGMF